MSTLDIALIQADGCGTGTEANLRRGLAACRKAADLGADLALFPELWQIAYADCPADLAGRRRWAGLAIDRGHPWLQAFRDLARQAGLAITVTYLQRWPGAPRNVATIIDRHGNDVLTYAKVHTCDWVFERWLTAGDAFPVAELDTRNGPVRVGVMICFDREVPESARMLMLNGAEVILTPNACPLTEDRLGQFRARAFENMLAVVMANYPRFGGRSCAFDGMAFASGGGARDHRLVEAGTGEEVVMARVDLAALRSYRQAEPLADAYRRPRCYGPIGATLPPRAPFLRPGSRRLPAGLLGVTARGRSQPPISAASRAPSSQHASRSFRPGAPVTATGGRTARQRRPVVIDSTARTAPVVSMPPCTYRP
jgi:N-carbamoylputrescine amidase